MTQFLNSGSAKEGIVPAKWRSWLIVATVLLATHALSAWYYGARYENRGVVFNSNVLTLDMKPEEWAKPLGGMDSAAYLKVAENYAAGRGVTVRVSDSGSTHDVPFYYWGPGAPVVFGTWLKLVGRETMWPFFWFAAIAQLIFGMIATATASLWTKNTCALATVAACTGFCPPLQEWFYGANLTSSEIVALVPFAAIMFALAKGFAVYHETAGAFWANALRWRVSRWFALAGLSIGLNSLVRDSGEVLASFSVVFLVGRELLFDRRKLASAVCAAAVLLGSAEVARIPTKNWNKSRIGKSVVSTGATWGVWYLSIWPRQDDFAWFVTSGIGGGDYLWQNLRGTTASDPCSTAGIGFGEFLDPAANKRVEDYFRSDQPHPELYSLGQLAQAVWKRPADAVAFKAARLPVLWLGTWDRWPRIQLGLVPWCCIAFYGSFALLCGIRFRRKQLVPEVLYLYMLLMVCASMVIHFEFRYTFPVWNALILSPGLLIGTLTRHGRQPKVLSPRLADSKLFSVSERRAELIAA